jgi:hypothetical protein
MYWSARFSEIVRDQTIVLEEVVVDGTGKVVGVGTVK